MTHRIATRPRLLDPLVVLVAAGYGFTTNGTLGLVVWVGMAALLVGAHRRLDDVRAECDRLRDRIDVDEDGFPVEDDVDHEAEAGASADSFVVEETADRATEHE